MNELLAVRVAEKRLAAEGICLIELESADGRPLPPYTAGAHIDLHLPGNVVRQYSLSAYRPVPERYQVAVLREPQSRGGSRAVHDLLYQGDCLNISFPRNLFPLASDEGCALLLAGGIGITPILCMAEFLAAHGRAFELHYCGRSQGRMAFLDRLSEDDMEANVHIHVDEGPPEQRFDIGRLLQRHCGEGHLYVCGPIGFIDAVLTEANAKGWTRDRIHFERFSNAEAYRSEGSDSSFVVEIASTGECVSVASDESIIEALARHGVMIETSCEQGICGTCLTQVKAGVPEHRDIYLSEAERERNDQLLPCCSRSRTPKLVLDI